MENQTNNETPQSDFAPQDTGTQPDFLQQGVGFERSDMNDQPDFGQPDLGNQPDFGQPDLGNQSDFGQPDLGNQTNYGQPDMNGQMGYSQPDMNGQMGYSQPDMNGQMGYGYPGMNGQPGYGQPNMNGQPGYGQPGMGAQGGYYQQSAGAGNGYYQAPGTNGYYPNQQPQKKGNGGVIALIVGVVLLIVLLLVGIVLIAFSATRSDDRGSSVTAEDDRDRDEDLFDDDDYEDDYYDDYEDDEDDYRGGGSGTEDPLAFLDDIDWKDRDWKDEPENHSPDEVGANGVYYELANCIDKNVSYSMVHENFEELERDNNVCIRINYYQLEGDISNIDNINEALKEYAMYYGSYYDEYYDDFQELFEEEGSGFVCTTKAYITYNDEDMISVVYDVYYETVTMIDKRIVCLNIDLESGIVTYNTDYLDITDEFLEDYKEICEDQNGYVSAFSYFDNDELRDIFEDEDELILYYTPFGLEVGFNYETNTSYGWVTATIEDYEQYMQSY